MSTSKSALFIGCLHLSRCRARHPWLTGSAGWAYHAATHWILGIRPGYAGLTIDPCIPADWKEFQVTRQWRGATYQITVRKSAGSTGRVARMVVDGRTIAGNLAPLPARPGQSIEIEAFVQ